MNALSPVWPNVPIWCKWGCTGACFCAHLAAIAASPDPFTDPFVLLVSLSVALNSVLLFALGLPLLLVDLYPHRFPAVSQHKIQPALNAPLPPTLVRADLKAGLPMVPSGQYDVIFSRAVLTKETIFPTLVPEFETIGRLLAPGGTAFISIGAVR